MPDGLLRIGELSRRTGLSTDVVRAWERRYDLLRPDRTPGGFRLYSSDDLSRLRLMQHYLSKGIPTAQAAGLVHQVQRAAADRNPGLPPGDVRRALQVLRDSLESFDEAPAARMLDRLLGVFAAGAVLRDVVLPYLHEVGERWASGRTSIAQEHFASSFLEGWMLGLARGWGRAGSLRAVLACAPGDRHTLGLVAFGLALRDLGWRVTYLGADAPLHAVEQAAERVGADAVVLSSAVPTVLADAAADIGELAGRQPVVVGGPGVAGCRSAALGARTLHLDPIVAAQTLTVHHEDGAAASHGELAIGA